MSKKKEKPDLEVRPDREGFDKEGLCKLCKEPRTPEGHDPCIANLPGVLFACCGHGNSTGNVKFVDGRNISFNTIEINPDPPKHYWELNPVPINTPGDKYRVIDFKNKKVRKEECTMRPIDPNGEGWKLLKDDDTLDRLDRKYRNRRRVVPTQRGKKGGYIPPKTGKSKGNSQKSTNPKPSKKK